MQKVIYKTMPCLVFIPTETSQAIGLWENLDDPDTKEFISAVFPEWVDLIYTSAEQCSKSVNVGMSAEDIRTIMNLYKGK